MKLWKTLLLGAFAVGAAALTATSFAAGIAGSPHDFSGGSYGSTNGQICLPCHVPHGAAANTGAPTNKVMWNHMVDGSKVYTLYSSSGQLDNTSRLCLSCHDGVYGVDNFGGRYSNTTNTHKVPAALVIGTGGDLSHDHPVGAPYPGLNASTGVWTSSTRSRNPTVSAGFQGGIGPWGYTLPLSVGYTGTTPNNFATLVSCNTCHNPHDNSKGDFLRGSNDRSALCLSCHIR